jgi:putative peptide zinc metalloprotease protein
MSNVTRVEEMPPDQAPSDQLIFQPVEGFSVSPLDTSYKEPRCAVKLANGKFIEISRKLCDVLLEIDGRATVGQIATNLSRKWNIAVTPSDVQAVIERFLIPYQLIANGNHRPSQGPSPAERPKTNWWRKFLLQDFFFHFKLIPSDVVAAAAKHTAPLFAPPLAVVVIGALIGVNVLAYPELVALMKSGQLRITHPLEYLWILLLVFASILFHELGHASAIVRYGGKPDHIGFGLYFIYPALYANVNQSWSFTRKQRMVIDLGGIYFQVMASLVCYLGYLLTHHLVFILTFIFVESLWVFSLIPFFKFDGYWFVSDALGIPNLRRRAFDLLGDQIVRLAGKRREARHDLELRGAVTGWVVLYAVSSLAFSVLVIRFLVVYAPARFSQYPGYVRSAMSNLAQALSNASYSHAIIVLINWALQTLILVGLTLVIFSLAAAIYQTARKTKLKL